MNKDVLSGKTTFRSVTFCSLVAFLYHQKWWKAFESWGGPAPGYVRPQGHCCGNVATEAGNKGRRLIVRVDRDRLCLAYPCVRDAGGLSTLRFST